MTLVSWDINKDSVISICSITRRKSMMDGLKSVIYKTITCTTPSNSGAGQCTELLEAVQNDAEDNKGEALDIFLVPVMLSPAPSHPSLL